jgi:hypothetical protein
MRKRADFRIDAFRPEPGSADRPKNAQGGDPRAPQAEFAVDF